MDLKTIWTQVTGAGDSAAALIGYATGFAVDLFVFPGGESAGVTAALWSVGALGLKKAADVVLRARANRKSASPSLNESASQLSSFVRRQLQKSSLSDTDEHELKSLLNTVTNRTELWRAGLLDDQEFEFDLTKWRRQIVQISSPSDLIILDPHESRVSK